METAESNPCSVIKFHNTSEESVKNHEEILADPQTDHKEEEIILNGVNEDNLETEETDQQTTDVTKDEPNSSKNEEIKEEEKMEIEISETKMEIEISETKIEIETGSIETVTNLEVSSIEIKSELEEENITSVGETIIENEINLNKSDVTVEGLKLGNETENTHEAKDVTNELKTDEISSENFNDNDVTNEITKVSPKKGKKGRKRKLAVSGEAESVVDDNSPAVKDEVETDFDDDEESETKPRRRGRCKKNPDIIPAHLSSDMVLGYRILLKFLETPQFSIFHKPFSGVAAADENEIICLNQIKKKFEENVYKRIAEFVNDVREMLTNIYESSNAKVIKRAERLEQVLEQRIAQLPNYLRPQCALILTAEEVNNSHSKIRMNKGGGFVSILLERAQKKKSEKDKEKRKLLAEERKLLKEEQDKDVQDWEKNVLLKDHEEEIKSMWELPAIGQFIYLCTDILNIGEIAQFQIERMLLMPQCSESLDLIMTALLSNSLVRAKLDRTPPMPYSIWGPLVRTRVITWYRSYHREGRNAQKVFEEIGVEPEFWNVLGPDRNPLDYYYFHELTLVQRVWILKTLCDVDFVRKKTVHDNIRAQTLDELSPVFLGVDRHGNRYIQLKQFCGPDLRIYKESPHLEGDITPPELIESTEGFEYREGPITVDKDKVFRDIWEVGEKKESKLKDKKKKLTKGRKRKLSKSPEVFEKKNLRQSARAKQKTYVDWSDSDQSDTDLATLKSRLSKAESSDTLYKPFSDKEFISLSVFRLPRDKVTKPTPKKSSYVSRKQEDLTRTDSTTSDKSLKSEDKKDGKAGFEEEASADCLDLKQMQDMQDDLEKTFQMDDMNEDDFDLETKLTDIKLDKTNKEKFTITNIENLKMVFKKGDNELEGGESSDPAKSEQADSGTADIKPDEKKPITDDQYDVLYRYNVPEHLKPDSSKFYLVVDSVDGLRQLISKFASQENDLEIISRSTKSNKKNQPSNSSCEVELIERLQNLLEELEPWELDLIKSSRSNREKMYNEYKEFTKRKSDFVHPNESYWMKMYEEPAPVTTASTSSTITTTVTTTAAATTPNSVSKGGKDNVQEALEGTSSMSALSDDLAPRKRTRVTRLQLKLDEQVDFDEELGDDEPFESSESDDNWEMPQSSKRRAKKEITPKATKLIKRSGGKKKTSPQEKSEGQSGTTDKSTQSPSVDKAKKVLFWGNRSSDPSEDLNWETNRQKLLEQHNNSPAKKVLFKPNEIMDDMVELESALQNKKTVQVGTASVIATANKRIIPQIPGNKKPYFSSAQLKAMENQAKQTDAAGGTFQSLQRAAPKNNSQRVGPQKPTMKTASTQMNTEFIDISNEANKTAVKGPMVNKNPALTQMINKRLPSPSAIRKLPQPAARAQAIVNRMPAPSATVNKTDSGVKTYQIPLARVQQVAKPVNQMQSNVPQIQRIQQGNSIIQIQQTGNQNQPKQFIQQIQIQQPVGQGQQQINQIGQIQQVQIPVSQFQQTFIQQSRPVGSVAPNVRLQQPVQVQTRFITPQQAAQIQGAKAGVVQQQQQQQAVQIHIPNQSQQIQIQNPTPAQQMIIQNQGQVRQVSPQLQNQNQVQPQQTQARMQTNPQGPAQLQVQIPIQKRVISIQTQGDAKSAEEDFYLTDGTHFVKADLAQLTQKDNKNVLTFSIDSKLDTTRQLLVIKQRKPDANPNNAGLGQGQGQQIRHTSQVQQQVQMQVQQQQPQQVQMQAQQQMQVQVQQQQQMQAQQQMQVQQQQQQVQMQVQQPQQVQVQVQQQGQMQVQQQGQVQMQVQQQGQQQHVQMQQQQVQVQVQQQPVQIQVQQQPVQIQVQQQTQIQVQQPQMQIQQQQLRLQQQQQQQVQAQRQQQIQAQQQQQQLQMQQISIQQQQQQQQILQQKQQQSGQVQQQQQQQQQLLLQQQQQSGQVQQQQQRIVIQQQQQVQQQGQPSTSHPQQNILVFNKSPVTVQQSVPTSLANFVIPASYIVSEGGTVQNQMDQQQNIAIVQQSPTYIIQKPSGLNKGGQPQIFKIVSPQAMTSNQNIIISPQNIRFSNQVIRPVNQQTVTATATATATAAESQTQPKPASTLRFIRPQNVINANQNIVQNKAATSVQNQRPTVTVRPPAVTQNQVRPAAVNSNQGVRFAPRNVTPTKATVITSTAAQASGAVASSVRPSVAKGPQTVRLQNANLQPTVIRTNQPKPTKIIARAPGMSNPVIIKLEDDEDEIRIVGERKITGKPVTVDYLYGELLVKGTPQGFKYMVKTSDGRDYILNDKQVEERRAAHNGAMK